MITIDLKSDGRELRHFWSVCAGAGRANEGLRANWQEHLRLAVDGCGFQYVRFHGLFHDDMFVYREYDDGRRVFNWQYIDDLFDRMLAIGARPFVELGFCPSCIATVKYNTFWWRGSGAPPTDYGKWAELVSRFAAHCIDRYGADEVHKWWFEVWNEPNLYFFFDGPKSKYFELYDVTARALKAVDPLLRVGGPATSNFVPDERFDGEREDESKQRTWGDTDLDAMEWHGVWIEEFMHFCKDRGLPLDFVSTHPYPTDYALDHDGQRTGRSRGVDACRKDLSWLRKTIDDGPYPDAAIHLTEWSSSPSARDFTHDTLLAATYIAKCNIESSGLVDSLSYWTFTDCFEEGGAGDTVFHGGFGIINFQGIPKPSFHAYRFLHALGNTEIARGDGWIATRRADGSVAVMLYNYPGEFTGSVPMSSDKPDVADATLAIGSPRTFDLAIDGLTPNALLRLEQVDQKRGNAFEAWRAMGSPEPPTREQAKQLAAAAMDTAAGEFRADAAGSLHATVTLPPWSIALLG